MKRRPSLASAAEGACLVLVVAFFPTLLFFRLSRSVVRDVVHLTDGLCSAARSGRSSSTEQFGDRDREG